MCKLVFLCNLSFSRVIKSETSKRLMASEFTCYLAPKMLILLTYLALLLMGTDYPGVSRLAGMLTDLTV